MRRYVVRWLVYVLSLGIAARLVDGVDFPGDPPGMLQVATVALLFGLLQAVVKPVLQMVACFLYVLTLGLIHFALNAVVLMLTGWLAGDWLVVDGFWPAFQAALIISLCSTVLLSVLDPPTPEELAARAQRGANPWQRPPGRVPPGDVIDGTWETADPARIPAARQLPLRDEPPDER